MAKQQHIDGIERFNRISKPANILFNIVFILVTLSCIIPLIFVTIISLSSSESIRSIGYSFIPQQWSFDAYVHLWKMRTYIGRAFFVSIGITVIGTILGLLLNGTMGYVLSRRSYAYRKNK